MKKLLLGAAAVGVILAVTSKRFSKPVAAKPLSGPASFDEVDAYIKGQLHRLKMPGVSLAIVEGSQIVHQRGFGCARPYGEVPNPQTPFFIGSLTKSFTALAVMQLVEAGKIELDAPVQCYLPWFRVANAGASAQMTVRHLLNQTSGLPISSGETALADFDSSPGTAERQARTLSTLRLTRPAGSAFEYSNSNYQLLGLIIEAASGESYADYVQEHILTPLEMRHTYTSPAMAKENSLAVGHQYWFAIPFPAPHMPFPCGSLAGGGLISTSEDMARYLSMLLNDGRYYNTQILSSDGINELHRGVAEITAYGFSVGQYGMGWFIGEIGRTKTVWHSGTLPHFGAYMALLPEQKKGVVLLFNACHHWFNPVLAEVGMGVAALLIGEQPKPLPFVRLLPWVLQAQLLIPIFQITSILATQRPLHRQRLDSDGRPNGGRAWGFYALLSLIPHLLAALTLKPLLGKRRDYLKLYMPDYSWLAVVCGSLAVAWSFLRIGLVFRAWRKSHPGLSSSV